MRIILTQVGKNVITTQANEKKDLLTSSEASLDIALSKPTHASSQSKGDIFSSTPVKTIDVKAKKIQLPPEMLNQYSYSYYKDKLSQDSCPKLPSIIDSQFPSGNCSTNTASDLMQNTFKLHDILKKPVIIKLQKTFHKNQLKKNNSGALFKADNVSNFRSSETSSPKFSVSGLHSQLSTEIPSENTNLIKYLTNKKDISYSMLEKISEYNKNKLNKLNKVCQFLFKNEDSLAKLKEKVEEKLSYDLNKVREEYDQEMSQLTEDVSAFKKIIDCNKTSPKLKDRYLERHRDMTRYWDRNNVNRFYHMKDVSTRNNSISHSSNLV